MKRSTVEEYSPVRNLVDYNGAGVYALIDENGKRYVGSSQNVAIRILQHHYNLARAVCAPDEGFKGTKLEVAAHEGRVFTAVVLEELPTGGNRYDLWDLERKHLEAAGGVPATYNGAPMRDYRASDYYCYKYFCERDTPGAAECREHIRHHIQTREMPVTDDNILLLLPDGTKARWAAAAEAAGKSLQRYIIDAVEAAVAGSEDAKKPEA